MSLMKARRFWTDVSVAPCQDGFEVRLDTRSLRTPGKLPLVLPTAAAADAVAQEWRAVDQHIDPLAMPATRWANSAVEKVTPQADAVIDMLTEYGGTDLLCYRATAPEGLVQRQNARWDPPLDWAAATLGARLVTTEGMMPVDQPAEALARLRSAVAAFDPFALTALHDLVVHSGSLVLGLSVARGMLSPAEAWRASRTDEDWQAEQWGRDSEAETLARAKEQDFLFAARALAFLE